MMAKKLIQDMALGRELSGDKECIKLPQLVRIIELLQVELAVDQFSNKDGSGNKNFHVKLLQIFSLKVHIVKLDIMDLMHCPEFVSVNEALMNIIFIIIIFCLFILV